MLAPLDNEIVFKLAFQNKIVFKQFVKDILGIDFEGEIETEKRFINKHSNIDFKLDIFAESTDKRVIIEIQRIAYDYHFDRFLSNFLNTITEQQQSSKDYIINKVVYSIIILTTAYKVDNKTGFPVEDEYLIQDLDPENLWKEKRNIFGHKQVFLNPYYVNDHTTQPIKDWLELINASIKNPKNYKINNKNIGIKTVAKIIEQENLDSETWHKIKIANETRNTLLVSETRKYIEGIKEGEKMGIRKGEKIGIQKGKVEGEKIGIRKGKVEGEKIGIQKGKVEFARETAKKLLLKGFTVDLIQETTGLSINEIKNL